MGHEADVIEELRRDNAALRERLARVEPTAAKYEVLVSIMAEAVLVLDSDGRYLTIEPTQGFPPEARAQLLGTCLPDGFGPEIGGQMVAAIRRSLATGEPGTIEFQVPLPDRPLTVCAVFKPLTADTVLWYSNDITAERLLRQAEQGLRTFEAVVERTPDGVALITTRGEVTYTNQAYRDLGGAFDPGDALLAARLAAPELVRAALVEATTHGHWTGRLELGVDAGGRVPCQVSLVRLPEAPGRTAELAVIARDLRPLIEAEGQRLALQEQVIEAQRVALRELSTPLLPIATGVVCMPLIGTIDGPRAQEMMERLLDGIVRLRAHTAILDVTGVRVADAQVADGLLQVARAARLLGAHVILTGIGPDIAQTLVALHSELLGITTLGDLRSGIAHALAGRGAPGSAARRRP